MYALSDSLDPGASFNTTSITTTNIAGPIFILQHYLLFIQNSNVIDCTVFLFAKAGNIIGYSGGRGDL